MTKRAGFVACAVVVLGAAGPAFAKDIHVVAGAAPGGDGAKARPFATLAEAEAVSKDGDRIYVSAKSASDTLSASLTLKPKQKLIGLTAAGKKPANEAEMPRVTSASAAPEGFIVKLAKGAEVSGIHFVDMKNPAVLGADLDFSGANVYGNVFSGVVAGASALIYSVELGGSNDVKGVKVTDNTFRDGDNLGGVRVQQRGASSGEYRFRRNHFTDLGGRAYHIHSYETAKVTTQILDSDADNIGVGNKNSDSILPYLMGQSQQKMLVRNFRYTNTKKQGNASNTGLEVFVYGWPRPEEDRINWCTACRIDIDIEDSVFDHPITDGVQLTNYGANTVMNVAIRRTKIIGATPRQVGGAVSLVAEKEQNSGSRVSVLVEDSELVGSSAFGFANTSESKGAPVAVIDLGGGPLGSKGRNTIVDNAQGAFKLQKERVTAKNNWFGGKEPVLVLNGEVGTLDASSPLTAAPKR